VVWDFAEGVPIGEGSGSFVYGLEWIGRYLDTTSPVSPTPSVLARSATKIVGEFDCIITDPPYYDAIGYAVLMDYFYVWLRRCTHGISSEIDQAFAPSLSPKWDRESNDGELIDDASRFGGDKAASKKNYEDGMARAFAAAHSALRPDGRFVIVFAHKHPDAWETLVAAIIRAGFVVDASWPIQTEMANRTRALTGAALSSSVWIVCRKRPETARPGFDVRVLEDMHHKITTRVREFWDAGIRGPDFVWAATGPALEAYSQHPVVKKANSPGQLMGVTDFLQHVRRIVVDFVVGRVLSGDDIGQAEASGLDDVTTYYLLHRHDFGFGEAPVGACILYAVSCGLSDRELSDQYDLVSRAGGGGGSVGSVEDDDESTDESEEEPVERRSGSALKLKAWNQRKAKDLGLDAQRGKPVPLIDQVHRIMRLWKAGDVVKVNEYLDQRALRSNRVFHQLLQALIELAPHASEERSLLESISNHVATRGVAVQNEMNVYTAE
jgi:putative DNA methylase